MNKIRATVAWLLSLVATACDSDMEQIRVKTSDGIVHILDIPQNLIYDIGDSVELASYIKFLDNNSNRHLDPHVDKVLWYTEELNIGWQKPWDLKSYPKNPYRNILQQVKDVSPGVIEEISE